VTIILRINVSLLVKQRFSRKECKLQIDLAFGDRMLNPTSKMIAGSQGCKACVDCCWFTAALSNAAAAIYFSGALRKHII
jgi:hypothetical protein